MKFVCADGDPAYRDGIRDAAQVLLDAGHAFEYHDDVPQSAQDWRERADGADGLFLMLGLPTDALRALPGLRVVAFAGTGVNRFVDLGIAGDLGVAVCNVPSYGANAVAEHALALMLASARGIVRGDRRVRAGEFVQETGRELRGSVLGVVGTGPIGARMIELGNALGMRVLAWTRSPSDARAAALGCTFVALDELLRTSDFVSVHLAHTAATEGLISAELLAQAKPGATLVNTARGELIDGAALATLLAEGGLRGAGLDVFSPEPPAHDDPLLREDRAVLTPHVGYDTPQATADLFRITAENLLAFAAGRPQNVVDA